MKKRIWLSSNEKLFFLIEMIFIKIIIYFCRAGISLLHFGVQTVCRKQADNITIA